MDPLVLKYRLGIWDDGRVPGVDCARLVSEPPVNGLNRQTVRQEVRSGSRSIFPRIQKGLRLMSLASLTISFVVVVGFV